MGHLLSGMRGQALEIPFNRIFTAGLENKLGKEGS